MLNPIEKFKSSILHLNRDWNPCIYWLLEHIDKECLIIDNHNSKQYKLGLSGIIFSNHIVHYTLCWTVNKGIKLI